MSHAATGDLDERLRNRARLLEFLKFRVLASQEGFFETWRLPTGNDPPEASPPATGGPKGRGAPEAPGLAPLDLDAFRHWLQPLWPAAATLRDDDLRHCLEQAHALYVDRASRHHR